MLISNSETCPFKFKKTYKDTKSDKIEFKAKTMVDLIESGLQGTTLSGMKMKTC